MLEFEATATVTYNCYIEGESEKLILERAKALKEADGEKDCTFDNDYITEAIADLYFNNDESNIELELYGNSVESDFETESIRFEPFESMSLEERIEEVQRGEFSE